MRGPIQPSIPRTRGTPENPEGRFERLRLDADFADEVFDPECGAPAPKTRLFRDPSRSLISRNQSPDLGFDSSINPYRGCQHGCAYCYARPSHEYLGFSAGLDFETRILAKPDAPALLRRALSAPSWTPQVVALSGVTDPYQPAEASLGITRGCLEVLLEYRNPVALITKSNLVTRDIELLRELAAQELVHVTLSVTSLDPKLQRVLEPRASRPRSRLEAIMQLSAAGVPVGVNVAPVIPGLTDHEMPSILAAAARAGAGHAAYLLLRLPHGVEQLFDAWLARHRPLARERVLGRIRALRSGRLNDSRFGFRHRGTGVHADHLERLFEVSRRRVGLARRAAPLCVERFRPPGPRQASLFPDG